MMKLPLTVDSLRVAGIAYSNSAIRLRYACSCRSDKVSLSRSSVSRRCIIANREVHRLVRPKSMDLRQDPYCFLTAADYSDQSCDLSCSIAPKCLQGSDIGGASEETLKTSPDVQVRTGLM